MNMECRDLVKLGVEIICPDIDSRGSSFILREEGLIGTNWHVVHNPVNGVSSKNILAKLGDEENLPATIKVTDRRKDFAILEVARSFSHVPILGDYQSIEPYQEVYFVGRGLDLPALSLHRGWISAKTQKDSLDVLQIDGPINQGNSGGAVFDREGRVIGIVTQTEAKIDGELIQLINEFQQLQNSGMAIAFGGINILEVFKRQIYWLNRNRHVGIGYAFSNEYIRQALSTL